MGPRGHGRGPGAALAHPRDGHRRPVHQGRGLPSLADSEEYGLARIVCGEPERALKVLGEAGYRAKVVKVAAVAVPDHPGGLAELFEALVELDVNIEYCYCFSHRDGAPSGRSRALASRRSRRPTSRQASGARRAIGLARRITGPLSL